MRVSGFLEAAVYGADLAALERFYVDVFGLEPVARGGHDVDVRLLGEHVAQRVARERLVVGDEDAQASSEQAAAGADVRRAHVGATLGTTTRTHVPPAGRGATVN